ncbi:type II secretion system protein N [Brevundimonas bacteroides]|uniref:type II secretion system protein N n=1 Tax=Brevundimonas bacteroides TaxID=74311 RepID=UPI000496BD68|nr:type II secretion system protein N [Brevundimonas bacteroides]
MTPERRNELALRAVSVLVVGSIAWALAALTWRLVGWDDGRSEVAVAESLPPLGIQAGGQDPDVARIVTLAPFGGGAASVGGLPASSLGLVLKGVLAAYPPSASTALIAVGEGPATIYGVGQSPAANAVIESIEIDHVILNVGGTRERLDFPQPVVAPVDPTAAAPGAGITVTPVGPPTPTPQAAAALAAASPVASAAAARPAPPPIDSGATPNVAAAAGASGVSATASGYRVGPNPSAELRRFGLQPGDVIESLNGQPVSGATSDQQLFEQARAAGQARVVVNRDGRRLTFTFPLR